MLRASKEDIEREYRRFLEDPHLKALNKLEVKVRTETMPIGIIKEEGNFKYVFDKETETLLSAIKKQREEHIERYYEKHWEVLFYGEKIKDAEEQCRV